MSAKTPMNAEERAEYTAWRERRTPYRDGSALQLAFVDGMRAQRALDALPTIDTQCSECGRVGSFRVHGDDRGELEVRCPDCGASTYERTGD